MGLDPHNLRPSDLTRLLGRFEDALGPNLTRVFAYIAAHPGFVSDRQWGMIQSNSEGERACGREADKRMQPMQPGDVFAGRLDRGRVEVVAVDRHGRAGRRR